ncbi:hypothetical protein NDN08_007074 [Rhodosorus marinus]|uniref:Anaphase-promoting complex subunit 4 WD40 domain-containing protein n=1 Tax=Rhodosorus marinus TaxID=101924 RepID=A0AAV8UFG9_9RHOD|nr:hypothetical protein NDN08_007074 [Rhodosorus marinus]
MEFERVRDGSGGMVGCERGFGTVCSEDGSLRLGKCDGAVAALQRFGGDGAVSGSEDGLVRLWDVRKEVEVGSVDAHDGPVTDVRVCELEGLVYSSGDDGYVKVWDVRTGRCVREFHGHNDPCSQIALLGNDKVASAGVDGAVWVWSTATGERIAGCQVDYAWPVWCIKAFDAHHVISGAHDGVIRVLDVQSGQMSVLRGHAGTVWELEAVSDKAIASASADGTIRIWNVETMEEVRVLRGHSASVEALSYIGNGRLLSGSFDRSVRLWNVDTGEPTCQSMERHRGYVRCVAPYSDYVLSASNDATLRIWNKTGTLVATLETSHPIEAVVTLKGTIVSGESNGIIRCWRPPMS